jgi:hypothetical protein
MLTDSTVSQKVVFHEERLARQYHMQFLRDPSVNLFEKKLKFLMMSQSRSSAKLRVLKKHVLP